MPLQNYGVKTKYMFVTLLYHSINRRNPAKTAISEEAFEAQMGFLHREGYSILTLAQAIDFISGKQEVPQRAVLLTFDDGFADNVLSALPLLRDYGMTATLFLVSTYVGQKYDWNLQAHDNIRHVTWDELQSWLEAGCEIGGHTHAHLRMTRLSAREMFDAVLINKQIVEENLHTRLRAFSYPYGAHNQMARDLVSKYYELAFSVERGSWDPGVDRFAINRLEVKPGRSIEEFAEQLERVSSAIYVQRGLL